VFQNIGQGPFSRHLFGVLCIRPPHCNAPRPPWAKLADGGRSWTYPKTRKPKLAGSCAVVTRAGKGMSSLRALVQMAQEPRMTIKGRDQLSQILDICRLKHGQHLHKGPRRSQCVAKCGMAGIVGYADAEAVT